MSDITDVRGNGQHTGSSGPLATMRAVTDLATRPDLVAINSKARVLSDTHLEIEPGLDQWSWVDVGEAFAALMRSTNWYVGDWVIYGMNEYDLDAEKAAELAGFSQATLQQIVRICLAIPPARRRRRLQFWTHEAVIALDPTAQDEWLDRAEDNGWGYDELRKAIKGPSAPKVIEVGSVMDVARVLSKKVGKVFTSCVVDDDGGIMLERDGKRYAVTITPVS